MKFFFQCSLLVLEQQGERGEERSQAGGLLDRGEISAASQYCRDGRGEN